MASYNRLGSYLLADQLASDPSGKTYRGLSIVGSTFDRHFLVHTFSDEALNAGLSERIEDLERHASNLAGSRGFGHNYHVEGGKTPLVAMDHVPGRNLAQMIEKAKHEQVPLGVDHTLSVLQGLAQSLIQLHDKGLHHGVLAPHSVWVSFEGATAILDAPYAPILAELLPKCPALGTSLLPYRKAVANPLLQDLFSLGAILYELLTFEKLPHADQIPAALEQATLKAAQEESPVPQEIVELLKRLLGVSRPFENAGSFGAELERVLYDGDYSPTTFNMAFFMHTLFREENELDSQAMKADQTADFTEYALPEPGTAGAMAAAPASNKFVKIAVAGVVVLAGLVGIMAWWGVQQKHAAQEAQKKAEQEMVAKNLELQKLAQDQWLADQKAQQLEFQVREAKNTQAREEAQKALDELQRQSDENKRKRDELLKAKAVIQQKNPTLTVAPAPAPAAPAPGAAPAAKPAAAAATQDTAAAVTQKAAPNVPHPPKASLPAALQSGNIVVSVKVFVDAQGRPLKVLIEKGVDGSFGYNEAAREAALASTYAPAHKDGQATSGWVSVPYDFGKAQ